MTILVKGFSRRLAKVGAARFAMALLMLLSASASMLNAGEHLVLAAPKVTLFAKQGLVSGVLPEVSVQAGAVIAVAIPETTALAGVYVMPTPGNWVRQMQITPWLGSPQQTLQAYLGQTIEFLGPIPGDTSSATYQPAVLKAVQPILVATSMGLQTVDFDQLRFPDIGLMAMPALALTVENKGLFSGHLAYIAPGLAWSANYQMVYDSDQQQVRVKSSATLFNRTKLSIDGAEITVVAGQLSETVSPQFRPEMSMLRGAAQDRGPSAIAASAGLQYQWRLPQRYDLDAGRTLQISLEEPWLVPAKLVFRSRSSVQRYPSDAPQAQSVPAFLRMTPKDSGPSSGHPIASGLVRVFQRGPSGQPMLMGEDQMAQTPAGASFEVSLGRAFDVRLTRTTSNFRVINDRLHEVTLDLLLENTGKTTATIELQEDFSGALSLLTSTPDVVMAVGQSVSIKLELAPQSKQLVSYTARVRY